MSTIHFDGVACDYALTAPKPQFPALVFVHGWLLSRAYWQPVVDQLAADYQCLTYDLRGFGRSQAGHCWDPQSAAASPYDLEAYAEDLLALLDHLNIKQAWLVGHSLGGSVALWAAHLAPKTVEGVICVNAGGGIYLQTEFEKFRRAGEQMLQMRPGWLRYMPGLGMVFGRMAVRQPIAHGWGRQRLVDFLDADTGAARQSLLDSTTRSAVHRLPQIVAGLRQPVHFVAGQQDRVMEPRYVKHLASFHPLFQDWGANVVELADCGHLAMVEQPEQVVAQVRSVLAEAAMAVVA